MARILFCFILLVINFSVAKDFYLTSTVKFQSPSLKTDKIITLFSKLNYFITRSKDSLNLTIYLYDTEVKIYEENRLISKEKYNKYHKTFIYSIKEDSLNSYDLLDNNPKDLNPWGFVKSLLLLYHLRNGKIICIVGIDSQTVFQKFDSYYLVTEKVKNLTISRGKVEFKKDMLELELETSIPKGLSEEVSFEIKSYLKAKLQKIDKK